MSNVPDTLTQRSDLARRRSARFPMLALRKQCHGSPCALARTRSQCLATFPQLMVETLVAGTTTVDRNREED